MKKNLLMSISAVALVIVGAGASFIFDRNVDAVTPAIHTRVSVNNTGNGQGGNNFTPGGTGDTSRLSANGRYAVFPSFASNLVSGDTNNKQDIFLRDLEMNTTVRVSVSASNVQANDSSGLGNTSGVAISQTGRYVAFTSLASNLIDGTTVGGGYQQVYLKDVKSNTLTVVTQKADGTLGNAAYAFAISVSNDGRFVLFGGGKNTNLSNQGSLSGGGHLYLADMKDRTFKVLTPKDGASISEYSEPAAQMSCDGSLVIASTSSQLTDDDTDLASDVYLFDIRNGLTIKNLTKSSNIDAKNPSISCNGDYVTFESTDSVFDTVVPSTNTLSHLYMYDRISESYSIVDITATGVLSSGDSYGLTGIDDQGNVAFSGSNVAVGLGSTRTQIFLKHKGSGSLELITRNAYSNSAATQATYRRASISSDGKKVVYAVGNLANSLFAPASASGDDYHPYDTNGYGDVIMSLTGL